MARKVRQLVDLLREIGTDGESVAESSERFGRGYGDLPSERRRELFEAASRELELPPGQVVPHLKRALDSASGDGEEWPDRLDELRVALRSPRRRALERLAQSAGGMKLLVEMRAEILDLERAGHSGLDLLEGEIADLLNGWFSQGFLFLEEIDRRSSFSKIQYLKERELVHPMVQLDEMGRRLGDDRMCFALYHVVMPDEPVVFIEVALSRGLIRSVHDIIDDTQVDRDPVTDPNTAIFYSINNTQNGLAGLGLGRVLLTRVTEALGERHRGLQCFATLSPMPGFRDRYLLPVLRDEEHPFALSRDELVDRISDRGRRRILDRAGRTAETEDVAEIALALHDLLAGTTWIEDRGLVRSLRRPLSEIAHVYLTRETDARGRPLNPVARFHLGNGATLPRANVNFGANRTRRGLEESCGLMANYVYSVGTFQQIGRTVRSLLPWGR